MPEADALYSALDEEITVLRTRYLDGHIPAKPEDDPEAFQYDVKAFCLMSHAAIEEYMEALSELMLAKVEADLLIKKTTLATATLLTSYGIQLELSDDEGEADRSCFDHIRLAVEDAKVRHSRLLRDNHGVSMKYLRKLLIPVGLNVPSGPKVDSLKKLAEARGSFAHNMAKLAKYGDYKKATKVLTPEEALDASVDCLAICSELRDRTAKVW